MSAGNDFFAHGNRDVQSSGGAPVAVSFTRPPERGRSRKRTIPFGIELAALVQRLEGYLTLLAAAAIFLLTLYTLGLIAQLIASGDDATNIPAGASAAGGLVVLLWGLLLVKIGGSLTLGARWAFVVLLLKSVLGLLGALAFFVGGTDLSGTGEEALPAPWGTVTFGITGALSVLYLLCLLSPSSLRFVWRRRRRSS